MRELREDSGAVARVRVRARGTSVLEVLERVQRAADGLVRGHAIEAGDEGEPAGVVLVGRVVEPERVRRPLRHRHRFPPVRIRASRKRRGGVAD